MAFAGRYYNDKTRISSFYGRCLLGCTNKFYKPIFSDKMFGISDLKT